MILISIFTLPYFITVQSFEMLLVKTKKIHFDLFSSRYRFETVSS